MRRFVRLLALLLAVLPALAHAQNKELPPSRKPASKAPLVPAEIAKKLHELGYPAVGDNADLGVAQWRSRTGRKTIGALNAEEMAAIRAEATPTAFGAYLGHPFYGYGFAVRQTSRAAAAALALEECRKTDGRSCEAGRQVIFAGTRCVGVAGYQDEVGADGKTYTAFAIYVGESAETATATAMRNCATDADGQKYCKPLFVRCADGGPQKPQPEPAAAPPPNAPPAPTPPPAPAPAVATPAPVQPPEPPPAPAPPRPNMAEIAQKLFILGFPVSGTATTNPVAAISQWRFRTAGKPGSDPLTPEEIEAIMSAPRPAEYGAFAGTPYSGFGLATQLASREQAEAEAITRCHQAKGAECEKAPPMVVSSARCIGYAGFVNELKADGRRHTLSAIGLADDPQAAMRIAMRGCSQDGDNAPLCKPQVGVCADGRAFATAATRPMAQPGPPAPAPPATTPPPPARPAAVLSRPSPEVLNKLFALGYPSAGRPYDDPAVAILEWRVQTQSRERGDLTADEREAILNSAEPTSYVAIAGDPLGLHGVAEKRDSRARAEVDAIALCRQHRGNCEDTPTVAAGDRCVAYAGFREEQVKPARTLRATGIGADVEQARDRAMRRCAERSVDPAACKVVLTLCADGRQPPP